MVQIETLSHLAYDPGLFDQREQGANPLNFPNMTDQTDEFQLYLNPDYGNGIFRRRIRLAGYEGRVCAELEDCNHGFRSTVHHDGDRVTEVEAEALRIPLTTCGGATGPIGNLVGTPVKSSVRAIASAVDPRANCTHLYDLTLMAIVHALRGACTWQYDMEVDDQVAGGASQSRVFRNGELVMSWMVDQWQITEGPFLGRPLYKGFSNWAHDAFQGDDKEAAFALQKAYFVSEARRYNMNSMAGSPATNQADMLGVCYSYSSPVVDKALRTQNSVRDFTNTPEQLLKFQ